MNFPAYLTHLTDASKVCRLYWMTLQTRAVEYDKRDRDFANLMRVASQEAGRLADMYAEIALYYWWMRRSEAA